MYISGHSQSYICYNSVYGTYLGCITLYTAANESTVKNGFMALIISALPKKSWRLPCHNAAKQFTDNIPRLHLWNTFNCLSVYFGIFIINVRTWGLNFLRGDSQPKVQAGSCKDAQLELVARSQKKVITCTFKSIQLNCWQ